MVLSMDRWIGKVAVVTGASSGIGAAITKKLVEEGMIVVGLARRKQKVEELASTLGDKSNRLHSVKCDISKEQEILEAFKWTVTNLGPVHVLVNNAGCFYNDSLSDGSTEIIRTIVDTNLIGLTLCCKEGIRSMKANNIAGHIININSILGHSIPTQFLNVSMYPATKFAVRAATETIRMELAHQGSPIKITSISPGATESEIAFKAIDTGTYSEVFIKDKMLMAEDIADAVHYAISTPQHVQIKELTIKPVAELY
ncbi:hypothetical protein GWI33_004666 [Rhynchophorus ferrugineus]|uniref:Uncharacterized protein n=1 Tax=Rhynchophorus ferrugineus TaxID=354439 RepID=A0A834MJV9_RHYFE|nr:hypothetical protein GWI33_004666 [Rhynchophorus ferrugineus]